MRILWRRLLVNPTTSVETRDGDTTVLRVDGLACDTVCAARTREALAALPGVTDVRVDLDTGRATITGAPHDPDVYERAVTSQVAVRPLRRAIEALHRRLGRRDVAQAILPAIPPPDRPVA